MAVAELPDAAHGRVEEGPVVAGDDERPAAPSEMLLEPLEGVEVEMVRRLVEHQQVGVGDDKPGQRGAGLLAPGQGARRSRPVPRAKPSPDSVASTRWSRV